MFKIPKSVSEWEKESKTLRSKLIRMLGIPQKVCNLESQKRGEIEFPNYILRKFIIKSEKSSWIPINLYLPKPVKEPVPAIVVASGHGGSKTAPYYTYIGPLYATLGVACLVADQIGEEERHIEGKMGTRAHDPEPVHLAADKAGRLILGKMIFDVIREIDFLFSTDGIDPKRIGVIGNSLGGCIAGFTIAIDKRISLAMPSGWFFNKCDVESSKLCTKVPGQRMAKFMDLWQLLAMGAPRCATLVLNGEHDTIMYPENPAKTVYGLAKSYYYAYSVYKLFNAEERIALFIEPDSGHRPYMLCKEALLWVVKHFSPIRVSEEEILKMPEIYLGGWRDKFKLPVAPPIDQIYNVNLHQRKARALDINIRPLTRNETSCLNKDEIGSPLFTLEGWLESIK